MRTDLPGKSVWLAIPEKCHMSGRFTNDRDIRISFGRIPDETTVVFERFALERLTRLAHELLAVPVYEEEKPANLPVFVAPNTSDNPAVPSLAAGENSTFIRELHNVSRLMVPYARWTLHPSGPNTRPFPFEDQMLLSVRLAALGHAVRELAYSRMEDDTSPPADGHEEEGD